MHSLVIPIIVAEGDLQVDLKTVVAIKEQDQNEVAFEIEVVVVMYFTLGRVSVSYHCFVSNNKKSRTD